MIADGPGWESLGDLVTKAAALESTAVSDPLNHVLGGYSRFRRYTPQMLRTLDIEASPAAEPLLEAVDALRSDGTADRLPAAELEVEPAAAHPIRSPPLGDGGVVPPAGRVPRRRRLAGAVPFFGRVIVHPLVRRLLISKLPLRHNSTCMPFQRDDYLTILRLLRAKLHAADPEAVDVVDRIAGLSERDFARAEQPKAAVLVYLETLIKVMSERSAGSNGRILNLANRYIRTEEGGPIQALTVQLSPAEQEIHQVESYDLARLPDQSSFIAQLRDLRDAIEEDGGSAEGEL